MKENIKKEASGSSNGFFKAPTKAFTQISNTVLRDDTLSLGAKGLFSLIASYITLPGFTLYKKYMQSKCKEGRHAFDTAWRELQDAGYLTHQRVRGERGTFSYEYSLQLPLEEAPAQNGSNASSFEESPKKKKNTFYIDATEKKSVKKEARSHVSETAESLGPSVAYSSSPSLEYPVAENQTPAPIYSTKKTLPKKTQSVLQHRRTVEEQIELSFFKREPFYQGPCLAAIDLLVDFMACEMAAATTGSGEICLSVLEQVDSCTISEFLEHMKNRQPQKIYHPAAYWTAAFKNYLTERELALVLV